MTRIKLKSLGQEAIATGLSNGLMLSVEGRVRTRSEGLTPSPPDLVPQIIQMVAC